MGGTQLHGVIDGFRRGGAFLHDKRGLIDHRHQQTVHGKARRIAHRHSGFAQRLGQRFDALYGGIRGLLGADHLDQLEYRHRVEEVHAYHPLRALADRRQSSQ